MFEDMHPLESLKALDLDIIYVEFCRLYGGLHTLFCIIIFLPVNETCYSEVCTSPADHKQDLHCNPSCTAPHGARHVKIYVKSVLSGLMGFEGGALGFRQSCRAVERQIGGGHASYGSFRGC